MTAVRHKVACDLCHGRKKLWLGGNDYVECPQCHNGLVEIHEHRVDAKVRKLFIPGLPPVEVVDLPQRSLISDSLIRRDYP